MLLRES